MGTCAHRSWLNAIALFAIAGMLSLSGDARAEGSGSDSNGAARSCCAKRVCPPGCCMRGGGSGRSTTNNQVVARNDALTSGLASTDSGCECRPGEPVSPASRQRSQSVDRRAISWSCELESLDSRAAHLGLLSRLIEPLRRPPRAPLYLTTERLLI